MSPTIYSRAQIGLRPPTKRAPFVVPAAQRRGTVWHHNGPALRLNTTLDPAAQVAAEKRKLRGIQGYHLRRGWSDSPYSFAVGQSGGVYEIRGFGWDQFANGTDQVGVDNGPDRVWFTIFYLVGIDQATGLEETPTDEMLASGLWLTQHLRDRGAGDAVLPHNAFKVKPCPGPTLTPLAYRHNGRPIQPPSGDTTMGTPFSNEDVEAEFEAAVKAGLISASNRDDPATREQVAVVAHRAVESAVLAAEGKIVAAVNKAVAGELATIDARIESAVTAALASTQTPVLGDVIEVKPGEQVVVRGA